jgi:hypothetical protein
MSAMRCPSCGEDLATANVDEGLPACPHCGQSLDRGATPRKGPSVLKILLWVGLGVFLLAVLICSGFGFIGYRAYQKAVEEAKVDIARAKIKTTLTSACQAYRLDHDNQWPSNLEALVKGDENGRVYLDGVESLTDPWGKRFKYDPTGPRNYGRKPDIWTNSSNGDVIGNW